MVWKSSSLQILNVTLLALGLLLSCNFPSETESADETPAPRGIHQTEQERRGLILHTESARTLSPAKIALILKATTEKDSALIDLTCDNFVLSENGEKISMPESEFFVENPPQDFHLSVLLLLDLSGSIIDSNLAQLKFSAHRFFADLLFHDAASANLSLGIYWFDGGGHINSLIEFTNEAARIDSAVAGIDKELSRDRSTNLYGAIVEGVNLVKTETQKLKPPFVSRGALIVFTDGTDRASRVTRDNAQRAVDSNRPLIATYSIGLGQEIAPEHLRAFGRDGFAYAEELTEMPRKFGEIAMLILNSIKTRYYVEYCSPKRSGTHKLTVAAFDSSSEHTHKGYGAVTLSFSAEGFEGGCVLEGVRCSDK